MFLYVVQKQVEVPQFGGFDQIGADPLLGGLPPVLVPGRAGQDQGGDAAQAAGGFDHCHDFVPVFPGQVEVQQDEVRPGGGMVGVLAAQVIHRRVAVGDDVQVHHELGTVEGFLHEPCVARVILHE